MTTYTGAFSDVQGRRGLKYREKLYFLVSRTAHCEEDNCNTVKFP
jgi:hypothetical protein